MACKSKSLCISVFWRKDLNEFDLSTIPLSFPFCTHAGVLHYRMESVPFKRIKGAPRILLVFGVKSARKFLSPLACFETECIVFPAWGVDASAERVPCPFVRDISKRRKCYAGQVQHISRRMASTCPKALPVCLSVYLWMHRPLAALVLVVQAVAHSLQC